MYVAGHNSLVRLLAGIVKPWDASEAVANKRPGSSNLKQARSGVSRLIAWSAHKQGVKKKRDKVIVGLAGAGQP